MNEKSILAMAADIYAEAEQFSTSRRGEVGLFQQAFRLESNKLTSKSAAYRSHSNLDTAACINHEDFLLHFNKARQH